MPRPGRRKTYPALVLVALSALLSLAVSARDAIRAAPPVLPTRPGTTSTFDASFREAVRDGDLLRIHLLLTGHRGRVNFAAYAQSVADEEGMLYCGNDWNRPGVPWTRRRFLPVFQFLVRQSMGPGQVPGPRRHEALLLAAAQLGDLQTVRYLVGRGADVNTRTPLGVRMPGRIPPGGDTPLLLAAFYVDTDRMFSRSAGRAAVPDPDPVVTYLLKHGANVQTPRAGGDTPLMAATVRGKVGTVRELLAAGANPSARDHWGRSALALAQNQSRAEGRDVLIALLAPVTSRDLFEASAANDAEQVRMLLRRGANPNTPRSDTGETPLMIAARRNAADAAKTLLNNGAALMRTDARGRDALHIAAESRSNAVLTLLLDRGANPNARDAEWTPLAHAIGRGYTDTALLLLRRGAKPGKPGRQTTVSRSLTSGGISRAPVAERKRLLGALVAAGLDIRSGPAVAYAAGSGDSAWLRALLDAGGNPNAHLIGEGPRENEATALTMAMGAVMTARAGYRSEQKVRPDTPNALRFKAQIASARQCFTLLLDRGTDVNDRKRSGKTALMSAIGIGAFDLADELRKRGAKLNAADASGRTALHRAVSEPDFADERALRYLVKRGANRSRRDKNGDTPLALARKYKHARAVALLTPRN